MYVMIYMIIVIDIVVFCLLLLLLCLFFFFGFSYCSCFFLFTSDWLPQLPKASASQRQLDISNSGYEKNAISSNSLNVRYHLGNTSLVSGLYWGSKWLVFSHSKMILIVVLLPIRMFILKEYKNDNHTKWAWNTTNHDND